MPSSREPEQVILSRCGAVLGKKTVLKSDHFPGCQNKKLTPHLDGAPNYRQVGDLPVYGVAIPTAAGIRHVLDQIGCGVDTPRRALWHNMREEPVLYINGRPFVLREVERPFTNLEYTGIDRARVEQMEERLKEDVLREAERYDHRIMVSDELPDGQMVDQWESITPSSVQTPLEVYQGLQEEGYPVDYERVPVTDEKSPKERDFDLLLRRLANAHPSTALVFNCQMGRGRTTTGMVVACLVHLRRTIFGGTAVPSGGRVHEVTEESMRNDVADTTEEALKRGEFTVIRSMTRVLEGGVEGKRHADSVIDKCSAMQNLREAIFGYRSSIVRQVDEKKREAALSAFVEYLERYYFLICFTVFLSTDAFARPASPVNGKHWDGKEGGFQMWMRARPELYSVLRRLLRRDPMGALGLGTKPRMRRSITVGEQSGADMDAVVSARSGEVLGLSTILKSDHFPGCQNTNLPEKIEGAPNFREVSGLPVYGVGNPTIDGVRRVLRRINDGGRRPVLWQNMREEPVVYVNGKPFVLREVERPFKNMLEYTGIERERVEQMEARLKEDILREADRYEGAVMVNHETESGEVVDVWEQVTAASVRTPLEVFTELQAEGFRVEYARVPITDGKAPKSPDFDALARNIVRAGKEAALVFNCQMGRGRTTTGTVIGSLVHLRIAFGRPLRIPPMPQGSIEYHDEGSSSGDELYEEPGTSPSEPQTPESAQESPPGKEPDGQLPTAGNPEGDSPTAESAQGDPPSAESAQGDPPGKEPGAQTAQPQTPEANRGIPPGRKPPVPTPRRALSGNYYAMDDIGVIRKIARLLENGAECRRIVDQVVDRCDAMQNLREAILHYRRAFNNQGEVRARRAALNRGIEYLERYFMLIIFAGFLGSDDFSPDTAQTGDVFKAWVQHRPEIRQMKMGMRLRPARIFTAASDAGWRRAAAAAEIEDGRRSPSGGEAAMESAVRSRTGSVLGRQTILKLYHFPGQKRTPITEELGIQGAPNLCKVEALSVYSLATPTVEGVQGVLSHIGAAPGGSKRAVLTDLREEVVVYVNGLPFVLRELEQHIQAMHYVGIEGPVVAAMEARLKDDIVTEARRNHGRVLLHREEARSNVSDVDIVGYWENVRPESVKTPTEVYAALREGGYNIDYARIPLTRERFPKASDVDLIQNRMDGTDDSVQFMFISHTGIGGVAYAMAITCLRLQVEAQLHGLPKPPPPARTQPVSPLVPPSRNTLERVVSAQSIISGRIPSYRSGELPSWRSGDLSKVTPEEAALRAGDYRDILSLVRVLQYGPQSKEEADEVIDRCGVAGRLKDDIYYHKLMLDAYPSKQENVDERRASLTEDGMKALRRYFYLIAFSSYLRTCKTLDGRSGSKMPSFSSWVEARPELGHLLSNLKLQ